MHDLYKYEYIGGWSVLQPDLQKYQWGNNHMPTGEV